MSGVTEKIEPLMVEVTTPVPDFDFEAAAADPGRVAVPATPPDGAAELRREVFGTGGAGGRDLEVLVYPRADVTERRPGVVLVHGGAWIDGGPEQYLAHAYQLAAAGLVPACTSYRMIREARWPACLEDVKCAIRWIRANAGTLGVDPDRIVVMGGSAGGHLAAMAALTPGRFEGSGGNHDVSSAVQAAVLSCPPMGLEDVPALVGEEVAEQFYELFFGDARDDAAMAGASAFTHISPDAPPFLVLYGGVDPITPLTTMRAFGDGLAAAGVPNELVLWRGRTHGFEGAPPDFEELIRRVLDFLNRRLGPWT